MIYPTNKLTKNIIPKIDKLSFKLALRLNKNNKPNPAFIHNPDIQAPISIPPSKYTFVIATLAAQFGITPTNAANKGDKYLFVCKKLAKLSSPN